jgi:ATP-binding cassette, subfamily B, bacterial CvaB/MchF/RaxB
VGCDRHVSEAIKKSRIASITIAHRPETIASADRVIVIHDGKVQQEMKQVRTQHDSFSTPQQMSAP